MIIVAVLLGGVLLGRHVGPLQCLGRLDSRLACLVQGLLGPDLLLPHGGIPALSCQKLLVGTLLDDCSGVQDNDLIGMCNGR